MISLVEEMLGSADPSQQKGPDYTVRELLDDFDRDLGDRLKDQPEVGRPAMVGRAAERLGGFLLETGRIPEAAELFAEARDVFQKTLDEDHYETADILVRLAVAKAALMKDPEQRRKGAEQEAEILALVEEATSRAKKVFGERDTRVASALIAHGDYCIALGQHSRAVPFFREALDIRKECHDPDPGRAWTPKTRLAISLIEQGEFAEVETLAHSVIEEAERTARTDHPEYLTALELLRAALWRQPQRQRDAAPVLEKLAERYRPTRDPQLARVLRELGDVRIRRQEYDKAEASCREAIECYQASGDPDVGSCLWGFAMALEHQGRFDDALEWKRRVLPWLRERGDHLRVASVLASEAEASLLRRDYASAESPARESLEIRAERVPDSWLRYNTMSLLGGALAGLGRYGEAEPLLLEAMRSWTFHRLSPSLASARPSSAS